MLNHLSIKLINLIKFANRAQCAVALLGLVVCTGGVQTALAQSPSLAETGAPRSGVETLTGHTATQVLDGTAIRTGHYNPQQKLRLTLAVKPPHMAEEEAFLTELQTKGTPGFHKFLTADEWNARFGPSVEDEQKVVDWATSQGFTITNRFANRLLVDVEAPAELIEKAFGVIINQYRVTNHTGEEEVDFANDRDPQIPASLSGILSSVGGLNSIQRFYRVSSTPSRSKGQDYVAGPVFQNGPESHGDGDPERGPANGEAIQAEAGFTPTPSFTGGHADPADIPYSSQSYDYNALNAQGHCCNPHNDSTGSPAVSSIALVTYGNFESSDVNAFFQKYGFAWNWSAYYVNGSTTPGTKCNVGASGCPGDGQDDEAPLDVEYSTATANSFGASVDTAHVYVYEAANGLYSTYEDVFNFIASDAHAKVISTSYGGSEADFENGNGTAIFSTMHGIFNTMVGEGFTMISASGDNGAAYDCSNQDRVNYPAADPDWVGAGGTRITFNSSGDFSSEVAWTGVTFSYTCSNNWGGGGGGVSVDFTQPSWQSGLGGTQRLVPDLALNADPYGTEQNYYYQGGLQGVGGTSIVAPELAGFFAQENSYLNAIGNVCGSAGTSACTPIGNPNPFIYEEGMKKNAAHDPFYDVTKGCNSSYYTTLYKIGDFCAGTGYDKATGWGSFNALQLAWALNWEVTKATGIPYVTFTGPATNKWYNTNQTVSWTINDYPGTGISSASKVGIAGETQGWDSIPADPSSEATPGTGNSFYSGPQFKNGATGCLSFIAGGCSGGVSQGCHYAYARGWNNQGWSTANQSGYPEKYGPLCYDTVAPTLAATYAATPASGWYKTPVVVTLTAADPGGTAASGIFHTYYGKNLNCATSTISGCSIYSGAVTLSAEGQNLITAFAQDVAGNNSATKDVFFYVDTIAPVTAIKLGGTTAQTGNFNTIVTVTLTATDNTSGSGVAHTYYNLDTAAQATYAGKEFGISTVGKHTVTTHSIDVAGNVETAHSTTFTIVGPTTTKLTASPTTAAGGAKVTLTATVTSLVHNTPTGTVTFKSGTATIGTATLTAGVATLTTAQLPVGTDELTAVYGGATYYAPSTSAAVKEVIQ
jgi:kumamolisin